MFIPAYYRNNDLSEVKAFIRKHSFGILVSEGDGYPELSHIPIELHEENEDVFLKGHISRANPQWKKFLENDKVTAIFSGPHTYVSSSWYNHINVPTWNYMAVHVSGKIKIVEGEELYQSLKELVDKYEQGSQNPVRMENLPSDMIEKYMKGIVGFRIDIEKIEGKWKMSQNRDDEDYRNIITELEKVNEVNSQAVATEMKKILINKNEQK